MDRRAFSLGATAGLIAGSGAGANAQPRRLDGPRRAPGRPPARVLIVLLHGFGSDGEDMISLAPALAAYAPGAAFAAPNGPYTTGGAYSWSRSGGRSADAKDRGLQLAGELIRSAIGALP